MRRHPAALALVIVLAGCGGSGGSASPPREAELRVPTAEWRTDFSRHTVPLDEFLSGGPGKDGIPEIDEPRFVSVEKADFLRAREPVIELVVGSDARAYPLEILVWHEIVNDEVGEKPVAVTFCPLCNTAIAFDRRVDGRTLDFGTTGNLRDSDLVMYDRQTESWWQQFGGDGVVGEYAGRMLRQLPARIVAWGEFAHEHPDGRVLSRETGYDRPYGENPYEGYDDVGSSPIFPVAHADDDRLPPKERVVFVERGGRSLAVPYSTLARRRIVRVRLGGHELEIRFRKGVASALDSAQIAAGRDVGAARVLENGKPVPFSEPFWFAVAALRPKVELGG